MIIEEVCNESVSRLDEAQLVWARKGNNIVKKYRCTSGQRKGRVVSTPSQCSAPINIKQRITLKKTKSKLGGKMSRKARKTKRLNPASRRLKTLNKKRK